MGSLPDIHQGIVPLFVPTPVKIGIQLRIRKFRSGIVFDAKGFCETKYTCKRFTVPFLHLINSISANVSLTGKIFFPAAILLLIKDYLGITSSLVLYKNQLIGRCILFIGFQELIPFILLQSSHSLFIKCIALSVNDLLTGGHDKSFRIKIPPVPVLIRNPTSASHSPIWIKIIPFALNFL